MTKSKWLMISAALGLLLLNGWKWWPADDAKVPSKAHQLSIIGPDQLALHLDLPFSFEPMERNPFEFMALASGVETVEPQVAAPMPPAPLPVQSVEQNESIEGKLKLGGVVYRNGKRYAYLLESGQGHFVSVGTVIFDRYKVEDISVRSLLLKDMSSGAEARLFLSEM